MKTKKLGICLLVAMQLSACGNRGQTVANEVVIENDKQEEKKDDVGNKSEETVIIGGAGKTEETSETNHKPQKTGKVKEKKQVSGEVIGGVGNSEVIAGLKGILNLSETDEDKLAALSDSIDMEEVEKMSDEEKQELVSSLDTLVARHEKILSNLQQVFAKAGIAVNIDATTGKITMEEGILFATNESNISAEGQQVLDEFFKVYAEVILKDDNAENIKEVRIEGNADTQGTYEYNLSLSQQRADAVKAYCEESVNELSESDKKMFINKVVAVGNSYDNPVYKEDGSVDMAASRRVEFKFILNLD